MFPIVSLFSVKPWNESSFGFWRLQRAIVHSLIRDSRYSELEGGDNKWPLFTTYQLCNSLGVSFRHERGRFETSIFVPTCRHYGQSLSKCHHQRYECLLRPNPTNSMMVQILHLRRLSSLRKTLKSRDSRWTFQARK